MSGIAAEVAEALQEHTRHVRETLHEAHREFAVRRFGRQVLDGGTLTSDWARPACSWEAPDDATVYYLDGCPFCAIPLVSLALRIPDGKMTRMFGTDQESMSTVESAWQALDRLPDGDHRRRLAHDLAAGLLAQGRSPGRDPANT